MSAGEVRENYDAIQESMRRGFAVGDPARRSRDGNGKIAAPVGPVTGRAVSRSEMEADLRPTRAGVRARDQPGNKGTYPGRPRGKMRGHI